MATENNIDKIVEQLSNLTVLEMAQLKKALEDKWGVKAQAAPTFVAPTAGSGEVSTEEESTDFKVTLEKVPAHKKIGVIKILKEITGLGLKESKDIVEGAPKVLKESAPKAEAQKIVDKIKAAGGEASMKGL